MKIGIIARGLRGEVAVRNAARLAGHDVELYPRHRRGGVGGFVRRVDALVILERSGAGGESAGEARQLAQRRGIVTWRVDECAEELEARVEDIFAALSDFVPISGRARVGRVA